MQVKVDSPWIYPLIAALGILFAYKMVNIPSRTEIAIFAIGIFLIPALKYPKFSTYYLLTFPLFVPFFRRLYYLVGERVQTDPIMLISDGVMIAFLASLILLWIYNKERCRDILSALIVAFTLWLFAKVFLQNLIPIVQALYGFKFNGLYVPFFFAGSYFLYSLAGLQRIITVVTITFMATACYTIWQIVIGFPAFDQAWMDSVTFTTLYIEGIPRPFGTYVSPAALSDAMCILLILGAYWLARGGMVQKSFGLIVMAAGTYPLLIATVRTNWIAAVMGLYFFFIFLRIMGPWKKGIHLVLLVLVAVALSAGSKTEDETQNRQLSSHMQNDERGIHDIMVKERVQAVSNPMQEYSLLKRMDTWKGIWNYSFTYPLGRGQNTTGYAHSYYFQILGETGYPGLLFFLAILCLFFHRGFYVVRMATDPAAILLARLFLTMVFMFSILNLTGTHLHSNPGDIYFWFSGGALAFLYRHVRDEAATVKDEPATTHSLQVESSGA